jgi:hypothetical protein
VPLGFPNAADLGLPAPPGYPLSDEQKAQIAEEPEPPEPSTIAGFTAGAQAGDEPTGGM